MKHRRKRRIQSHAEDDQESSFERRHGGRGADRNNVDQTLGHDLKGIMARFILESEHADKASTETSVI